MLEFTELLTARNPNVPAVPKAEFVVKQCRRLKRRFLEINRHTLKRPNIFESRVPIFGSASYLGYLGKPGRM